MTPTQYYYLFLAGVLIVGVAIQVKPPSSGEHYIGANTTRNGSLCSTIFMAGWDYDSFFGDVKIDGQSLGHIPAGTIIYSGPCKNITVESYNKAVQSYVRVYSYKYL